MPAEYADEVNTLQLCEKFHCLPSELDGEDSETIRRLLAIDQVIGEWRAMERRSKAPGKGRR